jgi:photosystem II stability/assembly factor-like uncharacterized protein
MNKTLHRFPAPTLIAILLAAALAGALAAPAHAAVTSPDGLWTWARPLPFDYPAQALAAPAPGTLFVATVTDDLLTTTDGGASWGWSHTGAVAGFDQPSAVDFVSASDGWVSGGDAAGDFVVLRTTDGGATWQSSLTIPGVEPIPGFSTTVVRFSDASSGWVVAGGSDDVGGLTAADTTDGGATWATRQGLPADPAVDTEYTHFDALAPLGPGAAVFLETDVIVGGTLGAPKVWRTTDGGATWRQTAKLTGDALINDVAFSSAADGWAIGTYLWHTTDGGLTWHRVRSASGGIRLDVRGDDIWDVGVGGALHSTDGGAHWTMTSAVSGLEVSFADASDGWVADGAVYRHTTDGGTTWSSLTSPAPHAITSLSAAPDGTVWGVAGRVVVSPDGGLHWRYATRRTVAAVSAVSARQAWAVGGKGLIMHTSDGGRHWTLQAGHVGSYLGSVDFVDPSHGWAGGLNGVVLRTTDGGRHWHYTREAKAGLVTQLSFADAAHGLALGRHSGGFLVTATGGRTWSFHRFTTLGTSFAATTLLMADATHGLVIGQPGPQCYVTSDGGATWQPGAVIPGGVPLAGRDYVSVAGAGANLCAVGAFGDVATSSDGGATWSNEGVVMGALSNVGFVGADELVISGPAGVMARDLATAPLP